MQDVRGRNKSPGEFRETQNWIGSPDDQIVTAAFVPPPVEEMKAALNDWETFVNDTPRLPLLVQCAILHYQFETIHPFLDGNGRLGRLLIVFFLTQRGRLPQPLLYVSSYFEANRHEYYQLLQGVRERGEWQAWIQFFLRAVAVQALDAVARAEELADLRETYRSALAGGRSRAPEVVDLLMGNPVLTTARLRNALGVSNQGAFNLLRSLEKRGWIVELGHVGRGGRSLWVASEVMNILSGSERPTSGGDTSDSDSSESGGVEVTRP